MSRNREPRGVPPIPRDAPIIRDLGKLMELPLRSTSEALSVLEWEAILVGMYWRLTQQADLRIPVDEKRWFFPVTK